MNPLRLELPYPPSVNHYYRRVGYRMVISREGRYYRQRVVAMLRRLNVRPLEGKLQMTLDIYPPDNRRRDGDNLLKCLWDSLQHGGAYHDDVQIKDFYCHMKEPCRPQGKVVVTLAPQEQQP